MDRALLISRPDRWLHAWSVAWWRARVSERLLGERARHATSSSANKSQGLPSRLCECVVVCVLALLGLMPAMALAEPTEFPIVYSTTTSPPQVKRAVLTYDPSPAGNAPASAVIGASSTIATLPIGFGGGAAGAADGLVMRGDGTIFVATRNSNIHRVDPMSGAVTFSIASLASATPAPPIAGFLRMDPSNSELWVPGVDGRIARVPIAMPLRPGVSHLVTGDDTILHGLAFVGGTDRALYSSPLGGSGGLTGSIGLLDTTTFATTRLLTDLPAAAASVPGVPLQRTSVLILDPLTGNVLLIGQRRITQIALDWSSSPASATVVSDRDVSTQLGSARLIAGTVDGNGRLISLTSDGRVLLVDYSVSELVNSGSAVVRVVALEPNLGNLVPLSGPGSIRTSGKLWASGGLANAFDGGFDERNGQLSIVSSNPAFGAEARTADDFYLEPDAVYRIDTVRATMFSSVPLAPTPRARVEVYTDCDGSPGDLIYTAQATVTETGTTFGGLRVLGVVAQTPDLWLSSGAGGRTYWLSVAGVADSLTNPAPWYWGTSGEQRVMGSAGRFRSASLGYPEWTSTSELPCGCSDFAFKIEGKRCDTIQDNGGPLPLSEVVGAGGLPGSPSLRHNADTSTQSADDFVVALHSESLVCYARARIYTNCNPIVGGFEVYETRCGLPSDVLTQPRFTAPFSRITPVEEVITYQGETLLAYDVEAFDLAWLLPGGRSYSLSVVLTGSGSLRQRALWAFSYDCYEPTCRVQHSQAVVKGASLGAPQWKALSQTPVSAGVRRDLSFYLAGRKLNRGCPEPNLNGTTPPTPPPPSGCLGDFNRDGVADLLDLLGYLDVWLAGCP